jgi:hypothetical protein
MTAENQYEVRVKVRDLADASKIIKLLGELGYKDVEMGPPRPAFPIGVMARTAEMMRGRFNRAILRALHELKAVDREHAADAEKIIMQLRKNPELAGLFECVPKGIQSRTVTMIASAILGDKHGLVNYDAMQVPRKFWLSEKGKRQAEA